MKLPRWDCTGRADQAYLEEWTNAQLDEAHIDNEPPPDPNIEPIPFEQLVKMAQSASEQFKRGRILLAAQAKDYETVMRLADKEELRHEAFAPPSKRGRGRAESEVQRPAIEFLILEYAAEDKELIQKIWRAALGKQNRTKPPKDFEIAARRWKLEPKQLANYLKNRNRAAKT